MSRHRDLSFSAELKAADNSNTIYDFITPQYDANASDAGLDVTPLSLEDDEDYQEENEDEEEERFSRQRSRSKSFNEHDDAPTSIVTSVDPSTFTSKGLQAAVDNVKKVDSGERSGPLQQREVLALKKGLEEATLHRNRDELIEEEEEKRAAESEKKKRTATNSTISTTSGIEPQMRRVKILILGDSGVGKSCLITRWTADDFSANIVSTVGVNFKSKRVHLNNEYVQVQVWDTAGQEHFHKITTSYYRGANGIMLVYDVSDPKTMENAEYWIKNIKSHASESVRVALIGNKTDLRLVDNVDCTDRKLATGYAEMFGVPYFETSAKESTNVDLAFMSMVEGILAHDCLTPKKSPLKPQLSPSMNVDTKQSLTEKATKLKKGMFDKIRGKRDKEDPITPKKMGSDEKEKCLIS